MLPAGGGYLMVEFGADTADEARGRAAELAERSGRQPVRAACKLFIDEREQKAVWELRESGLGASAVIAGRPRTWPGAEDTAVAPGKTGRLPAPVLRPARRASPGSGNLLRAFRRRMRPLPDQL